MNVTSFAKVYALWHGTQTQEQLCGFGHTFRDHINILNESGFLFNSAVLCTSSCGSR